jgi:CheY-like chemotaxis protein
MRILVVDDEPAVRESLERSLRFEGYQVIVAADGAEALERVRDDRPDAVVLDVLMPRLDGLEACRRLRARGDDLPVLLLTARDGVAAARALVARPAIVFADEPTGNLDSRSGAELLLLLGELHRDGTTIVVVTHDHEVAAAMERRVELLDGRVVADSATVAP